MQAVLRRCLDDLERRLDDGEESRLRQRWLDFLEDRTSDDVFVPAGRAPCQAAVEWPRVGVNQAIRDADAMLLQQFRACSDQLDAGSHQMLNVRCNYGTGILPMLFGCELFMMDEAMDTLPSAMPLHSRERMAELVKAGVPNLRHSLGGQVFDVAERFLEVFDRYPAIRRNVSLYHPDWQGPIDVAEVVWGSDIFLAFYDDPDLVRGVLGLITDTYAAFARAWYRLVGAPGAYNAHWGLLHQGALMLRNDSLVNLSPEHHREFVLPHDQRLLDEFGGGVVHYCGRGSHFIEGLASMRGLTAVNLSQPHLNDMEAVLAATVDRGIKLLAFNWKDSPQDGRRTRGRVHAWWR